MRPEGGRLGNVGPAGLKADVAGPERTFPIEVCWFSRAHTLRNSKGKVSSTREPRDKLLEPRGDEAVGDFICYKLLFNCALDKKGKKVKTAKRLNKS